jgi:hypothetical protein
MNRSEQQNKEIESIRWQLEQLRADGFNEDSEQVSYLEDRLNVLLYCQDLYPA